MRIFALFTLLFTFVYAELKPTATEGVVNAIVTDFSGTPLVEETITFVGQSTGLSFQGVTDAKGKFTILCGGDETFKVFYQSLVGPYEVGEFQFPKAPFMGSIDVQFENKTVTLRDVLFDSGKATLKNSSYVELKKLLKGLKSDSTILVEIAGHTDDRGEEEDNQRLSEARAQTVKNYLVKNGILESRLEAKGYGESQPVQSNDTKAGRQANRRTEVRILEKEP